MIERNLGNIERILRLIAGVCLAVWAVMQQGFTGVAWFIVVIATFLILNGVFGRCYLWYVLAIDSNRRGCRSGSCQSEQTSSAIEGSTLMLAAEHAAAVDSRDQKLAETEPSGALGF